MGVRRGRPPERPPSVLVAVAVFVWRCPEGHVQTKADIRWLPTLREVVCRRCGRRCERRPTRARRQELDALNLEHPTSDEEAAQLLADYEDVVVRALDFDD